MGSNNFLLSTCKSVKNYIKVNYGTLAGLAILCIFISVLSPVFMSKDNMLNVLRQVTINGIIAIGLTFVILIGGVDLSVGSTCAAAGCLVVILIEGGVPLPVAILITCVFGAVVGVINGIFVAYTTLPFFIITLASQTVVRGLAYLFTNGYPVTSNNVLFNEFGNGYFHLNILSLNLEIPYIVILMFVLFVVFGIILGKTKFGRHVYAIGGNKEAALHSGINVKGVQITVFIISGVLASIAGMILASRMYSGQPTVAIGAEGDAIAASVLGGTSFGGGYGTMGGTIIGILIIGVMNNGMNLLRIDFYYQLIVKGIVILGAVYFDSIKGVFVRGKKTKKDNKTNDAQENNISS